MGHRVAIRHTIEVYLGHEIDSHSMSCSQLARDESGLCSRSTRNSSSTGPRSVPAREHSDVHKRQVRRNPSEADLRVRERVLNEASAAQAGGYVLD